VFHSKRNCFLQRCRLDPVGYHLPARKRILFGWCQTERTFCNNGSSRDQSVACTSADLVTVNSYSTSIGPRSCSRNQCFACTLVALRSNVLVKSLKKVSSSGLDPMFFNLLPVRLISSLASSFLHELIVLLLIISLPINRFEPRFVPRVILLIIIDAVRE
jgi:hypothetical protein